jgi:DNA-binding transcriptional regulator LsrR (DeoR family)
MIHAFNTGLSIPVKGEKHGRSKLTRACAERIKYGHQGMTQKEIAEIYGIAREQVSAIRSGKNWQHI